MPVRPAEVRREETVSEQKKCPVNRSKVLIALERCRAGECSGCQYDLPFDPEDGCQLLITETLAYIGYLEAQLGVR